MGRVRTFAGISALVVATGAAYGLFQRPWMTTWGATAEEAEATLPGDELIPSPRYQTTHAVTVSAPVRRVWPWLVQMGQGRGGLYSYDRLENLVGLGFHSADRIIPELQSLAPGDLVRLTPEDVSQPVAFEVTRVEPPHVLVLGPHGGKQAAFESGMPYPTWAFCLTALDPGTTRLVVRFRSDFKPSMAGLLMNKYALEPVHFLMERKMMLGIKDRAEHTVETVR